MDNNYKDIAKTLEKYPPYRLCDDWDSCTYDCDIQARDMHCEDCDFYWELVELAEKGEIGLRDIEKEKAEWKRICEICGMNYIDIWL